MHECAVLTCSVMVRLGLLMCSPHWRRVSFATKQEVYATWRTFQNASVGGNGAIAALWSYQSAVAEAVAQASPKLALVEEEGRHA